MRWFELHRDVDATGVSGTGVVAEGVEFGDGRVVMRWKTAVTSAAFYDSISDVEAIHGHGGDTRVVWLSTSDPDVSQGERGVLNERIMDLERRLGQMSVWYETLQVRYDDLVRVFNEEVKKHVAAN